MLVNVMAIIKTIKEKPFSVNHISIVPVKASVCVIAGRAGS
jgi:hypothetical protein